MTRLDKTRLDYNLVDGVIITGFCFFLRDIFLPRYCHPNRLPKDKYDAFDCWSVSWIHAVITGIGSSIALALNPGMWNDLLYFWFKISR